MPWAEYTKRILKFPFLIQGTPVGVQSRPSGIAGNNTNTNRNSDHEVALSEQGLNPFGVPAVI